MLQCEGALAAPLRKSVAVDPALLLGDGNGIWGNQEVIGLRIVERIFFLTDTAAIGRESK